MTNQWTVSYRWNDVPYSFTYPSYELAFAKFLYFQSLGYGPTIHTKV